MLNNALLSDSVFALDKSESPSLTGCIIIPCGTLACDVFAILQQRHLQLLR
jgi:hypothetical protein